MALPLLAALSHLLDKALDIDDLHALEVFEVEQMRVTGNDVISRPLQRTGQKLVIRRVCGEAVCRVHILGNNGLAEHQTKEAPDCLCSWLEPLLNPRIVQYAADLS